MKNFKNIILGLIGINLLSAQTALAQDLTVMSFTDELQPAIDKFEEINGVEVELQIIPNADYRNTLQPILESGAGAPDVFTGEIVFMKQWLDAGYWKNLSEDPFNVDDWSGDYVEYVFEAGKDSEGSVRALSWQTTPGGIYYRRSIAKEVLGTDDPTEIGELFSSMDSLMEVGSKMKEAGYALFPGEDNIFFFMDGSNPQPWVNENNELVMTEEKLAYFDYAKELRDNQYTALAPKWSPAWYESMNGPIPYNAGWDEVEGAEDSTIEVFAVALPTWALNSVFKQVSNQQAGDWAVTGGPTAYFEGGTWIGVYEGTENADLAFKFVEFMTHNEEWLTEWAAESGDVLSYLPVTEKIKGDVSEEFLGGQNHYEFFLEQAEQIDFSNVTAYDQQLNDLFGIQVEGYINGDITKEEGIEEFYRSVSNAFPEIVLPN